ncbi:MAG TPA: bifunctional phosphopantothenoylcysteine decarboxylase/phosphopantothenate--cysteine ligase CoaBC [Halanaerobiales bacterium]|nr:bifunctional phosphopantothenoylcysteine decarboxylase/phosphopantothenate--cysteine ligase CoaBC [Halanaerobiales bacterium]
MDKNIVLGISGGVAAYKMVEVASRLIKLGANVDVIMTESATEFIKPLTFRSITHRPVESNLFSPPESFEVKHISLAKKADLFLIAPATANIIGKIANGIADDLLTTIITATQAPVLISPAMNVNMYNNPIVQDNMDYLQEKGYNIINSPSGYLACGDVGEGRLPEPYQLVENIKKELTKKDFKNKKILITAGPTREAIDPVRFISNYSSGKMGYELARMASYRGADVTLVSGPSQLEKPLGVNLIKVKTAEEMKDAVINRSQEQDIIIKAAAVSDLKPKKYNKNKLKKKDNDITSIEVESTPDILAELGKNKPAGQILVGFAAESEYLIKNSLKKLKDKNLDMIIANDITRDDAGFQSDKNEVEILTKNTKKSLTLMEKIEIADTILDNLKNI